MRTGPSDTVHTVFSLTFRSVFLIIISLFRCAFLFPWSSFSSHRGRANKFSFFHFVLAGFRGIWLKFAFSQDVYSFLPEIIMSFAMAASGAKYPVVVDFEELSQLRRDAAQTAALRADVDRLMKENAAVEVRLQTFSCRKLWNLNTNLTTSFQKTIWLLTS